MPWKFGFPLKYKPDIVVSVVFLLDQNLMKLEKQS